MMLPRFRSALTLMELIMVVVLIGILATMGIANFRGTILKAKTKEAQALLGLIQHAEEVVKAENNTYIDCASTSDCNSKLRLNLPNTTSATWTYTVSGASTTTFCALADTSAAGLQDYHIRKGEANATSGGC